MNRDYQKEVFALDTLINKGFGTCIAMSGNGQRLFIGIPKADYNDYKESGIVHVFKKSRTGWIKENQIAPYEPQNSRRFGLSIATNYEGNRLIVSSPYANWHDRSQCGYVSIYDLKDNEWVTDSFFARIAEDGQTFGAKVVMSQSGATVAILASYSGRDIGDFQASINQIYVYHQTGKWFRELLSTPEGLDIEPTDIEISGNGNSLIVASGHHKKFYFFERSTDDSRAWVYHNHAEMATGICSLSINHNGDTVAKSSLDNNGLVTISIFNKCHSDHMQRIDWSIQTTLLFKRNQGKDIFYRGSLAINDQGNRIYAGLPGIDPTMGRQKDIEASGIILVKESGFWRPIDYLLTPAIEAKCSSMGCSIAVDKKGHTIALGGINSNSVYLYGDDHL